MNARSALRAIAPIAESQRGLVTTAQAAHIGVSKLEMSRLASSGDLDRVTHGVYRVAGADTDEYTDVYANWLSLDPHRTAAERIADRSRMIAVSHRSAARIYRIGDLPANEHAYTATYRKQSQRPDVRIHTGPLTREDVRVEQGMLVTTPERTIADLSRSEPDTSHVANALADAITDRQTSREKVVAAVAGRSQRARAREVDNLLALRGLDTSSLVKQLSKSVIASDAMRAMSEQLARSWSESVGKGVLSGMAIQNKNLMTPALRASLDNMAVPKPVLDQMRALTESWSRVAIPQILAKQPWESLNNASALQRQIGETPDDE